MRITLVECYWGPMIVISARIGCPGLGRFTYSFRMISRDLLVHESQAIYTTLSLWNKSCCTGERVEIKWSGTNEIRKTLHWNEDIVNNLKHFFQFELKQPDGSAYDEDETLAVYYIACPNNTWGGYNCYDSSLTKTQMAPIKYKANSDDSLCFSFPTRDRFQAYRVIVSQEHIQNSLAPGDQVH
jgi:hypothetical protein